MTLIRCWQEDGYKAELYDYDDIYHGKPSLTYYFYHRDELIFNGSDFCPSILHDFSDDKTLGALLGHLSVKPGDTDREHFEDYTLEQLAFVKSHGDYLSILASELESY